MNKILAIIKREYMTRVRSKGFIIGTVLSLTNDYRLLTNDYRPTTND